MSLQPETANLFASTYLSLSIGMALTTSYLAADGYFEQESNVIHPTAVACSTTDPAAHQAVGALLEQPADPLFQPHSSDRFDSYQDYLDTKQAHREAAAKAAGVSIVDLTPSITKIFGGISKTGRPLKFMEVLNIVDTAMKPFGVDVSVQPSSDTSPNSQPASSLTDLNASSPEELTEILRAFDDTPIEQVQTSKLRHIKLYQGGELANDGGYVSSSEDYDTLHLNVNRYDSGTVHHEFGHILHATFLSELGCPSITTDPTMAALNGVGGLGLFVDRTPDRRYANQQDYRAFQSETAIPLRNAIEAGDRAAACEIIQNRKSIGSSVVSVSAYHTNVAEEVAEASKELLDGNLSTMLDPNSPKVAAESRLILDRFDAIDPASTKYLLATADRKTSYDSLIDC